MSGGDGEKDAFFHCLDRVPSGLHLDADFPSDEDDDDDEDVRVSFASAMGDQSAQSFRRYQAAVVEDDEEEAEEDPSMYDMWMSDDHLSIQERRRRLHQGLGMASSRDLALRRHSMKKRPADVPRIASRRTPPLPSPTPAARTASPASLPPATAAALKQPAAKAITRRRSDSSLAVRDVSAKPPLRRVRSLPARHDAGDVARIDKAALQNVTTARQLPVAPVPAAEPADKNGKGDGKTSGGGEDGAKSQGKDIVVAAAPSKDDASSTSAPQSGVLGLDEIEKFIGNTPIMKHLVRRGTSQHHSAPLPGGGAPPKAEKASGKKKGGWLKNIKSVAIGFIQDKDTTAKSAAAATSAVAAAPPNAASAGALGASSSSSSERLKVHQYGKSSKELTGLYMSQVRSNSGPATTILGMERVTET